MAALPYKFLLATATEGRTTKDKSFRFSKKKNKQARNLGKLTKTGKASLKNKCCSNNPKNWSAFINFGEHPLAAGLRLQPRT